MLKYNTYFKIAGSTLLLAALLAGCSKDPWAGKSSNKIVFVTPGAAKVLAAGTKADIYSDGTVSAGSFGVSAYRHGTTTAYFSNQQVNYVAPAWEFAAGPQYWPASGTLDFDAWMPASVPSYITNRSYAAGAASFDATLPLTLTGQDGISEYVYAYVEDKGSADGEVELSFKRPFAQIQLRLAEENEYPGYTIDRITLKEICASGSYAHGSGWSAQSGRADMVLEGRSAFGTPMLALPQTFTGGKHAVTVDYTQDNGVVRHLEGTVTVPVGAWEAGKKYTYSVSLLGNIWIGEGILWVGVTEVTALGEETINWTGNLSLSGDGTDLIDWTGYEQAGSEGENISWIELAPVSSVAVSVSSDKSIVYAGDGGQVTLISDATTTSDGPIQYLWSVVSGSGYLELSDASSQTVTLRGLSAGYATVKCTVNGVDSETITVAVAPDANTVGGLFSFTAGTTGYFSKGNLWSDGGTLKFTNNQWDYGTNLAQGTNWSSVGSNWSLINSWDYIISSRASGSTVNGTSDARYTHGTVNTDATGANGLILFPDNIIVATSEATSWGSVNDNSDWGTKFTSAQWKLMELMGCIFLSPAGCANGHTLGSTGDYWSSGINQGNGRANYNLVFMSNGLSTASYWYGPNVVCSIRLVQVLNP